MNYQPGGGELRGLNAPWQLFTAEESDSLGLEFSTVIIFQVTETSRFVDNESLYRRKNRS